MIFSPSFSFNLWASLTAKSPQEFRNKSVWSMSVCASASRYKHTGTGDCFIVRFHGIEDSVGGYYSANTMNGLYGVNWKTPMFSRRGGGHQVQSDTVLLTLYSYKI
jgi:hypothetical protein